MRPPSEEKDDTSSITEETAKLEYTPTGKRKVPLPEEIPFNFSAYETKLIQMLKTNKMDQEKFPGERSRIISGWINLGGVDVVPIGRTFDKNAKWARRIYEDALIREFWIEKTNEVFKKRKSFVPLFRYLMIEFDDDKCILGIVFHESFFDRKLSNIESMAKDTEVKSKTEAMAKEAQTNLILQKVPFHKNMNHLSLFTTSGARGEEVLNNIKQKMRYIFYFSLFINVSSMCIKKEVQVFPIAEQTVSTYPHYKIPSGSLSKIKVEKVILRFDRYERGVVGVLTFFGNNLHLTNFVTIFGLNPLFCVEDNNEVKWSTLDSSKKTLQLSCEIKLPRNHSEFQEQKNNITIFMNMNGDSSNKGYSCTIKAEEVSVRDLQKTPLSLVQKLDEAFFKRILMKVYEEAVQFHKIRGFWPRLDTTDENCPVCTP
jgi:hypothetical protein